MRKFSKREAIKFGWQKMWANFWFFVGVILFVVVVTSILQLLSGVFKETSTALFAIFYVANIVVSILFGIGLIKIAIDFSLNIKGKFKDLFSQYRLFLKYLVASILYFIIVTVGFILLIVPGIIWAIKFSFFPYFIVDRKMGAIEALKASGRVTKNTRWNLFLFCILLGLINLAGFIVLGIGLFFTIPITIIALAFVYHKLLIFDKELATVESDATTTPEKAPEISKEPTPTPTPTPEPQAQPSEETQGQPPTAS